MSNFNLPPGCTEGDIDHNAGTDRKEHCVDCDWLHFVCDLDDDNRCERCARKHQEALDEEGPPAMPLATN